MVREKQWIFLSLILFHKDIAKAITHRTVAHIFQNAMFYALIFTTNLVFEESNNQDNSLTS